MQLKNINDEYISADIIRYFNYNDLEYLIYSLGETDEAGYVRLYASKIIGDRACIISDNDEWQNITQLIKETVRNNRDGNELSIVDLNENKLIDITLQDTRIFKLQGNLVTLLSENKNVVEETKEFEDVQDEIIEEELNYELMYNEQLEKNNNMQAKLESLENEIEKYKETISRVKELLDNEDYYN